MTRDAWLWMLLIGLSSIAFGIWTVWTAQRRVSHPERQP